MHCIGLIDGSSLLRHQFLCSPLGMCNPGCGNIIVTVNERIDSAWHPVVHDYTVSGVRVQTFDVPLASDVTQRARDLVFGPGDAFYLYNGTFSPTLERFDFGSSTWTSSTFAGWSTVNNGTYGGLASSGQYVFASDMETASPGVPQGIVRFDTSGGATVRFAQTIEPGYISIGADGIYAIDRSSSPQSAVHKFDPNTFASLGTIPINFDDNRAVAALADHSIFVATHNGVITHYSADGTLLKSLTVGGVQFSDIDISSTGQIVLGTVNQGDIVLTDIGLNSSTRFHVDDTATNSTTFVAWVVPEPSTGLLDRGFGRPRLPKSDTPVTPPKRNDEIHHEQVLLWSVVGAQFLYWLVAMTAPDTGTTTMVKHFALSLIVIIAMLAFVVGLTYRALRKLANGGLTAMDNHLVKYVAGIQDRRSPYMIEARKPIARQRVDRHLPVARIGREARRVRSCAIQRRGDGGPP